MTFKLGENDVFSKGSPQTRAFAAANILTQV